MTSLPYALFLVVCDFGPGFGIGSTDITMNRSAAYDDFASAVEDGNPVAVWKIIGASEVFDITDTMAQEMHRIRAERGLEPLTFIRFAQEALTK